MDDAVVRVVIAEDDVLLIPLLRHLVERNRGMTVVGLTGEPEETVRETLFLKPDVLLLDLHEEPRRNLWVAGQLHAHHCNSAILIVAGDGDTDRAVAALRIGVKGFIARSDVAPSLCAAICTVVNRGAWIRPPLAYHLIDELDSVCRRLGEAVAHEAALREELREKLDEREIDVVQRIGRGQTNAEIGRDLYLSESAVKQIVSSILRQLGFRNRTEAALHVALYAARRRSDEMTEAIRHLSVQYDRILQIAVEGIWILDEKQKTTYVSERMAAMLGYTVCEIVGHPQSEFLFEEDREGAAQGLALCERGAHEAQDFRYRRSDGTAMWGLVSSSVVTDAQGSPRGELAMVTDLTERKQMEERLRQSEESHRCALQSIVDAITDPVGTIQKALNDLDRISSQEEEPRRLRAEARHEVGRLLQLIKDLPLPES